MACGATLIASLLFTHNQSLLLFCGVGGGCHTRVCVGLHPCCSPFITSTAPHHTTHNTTPLPSCPHPSLPCCSLPSSSPTPTTTLLLVVLIVVGGNATVLDVTTSWRAHTTPPSSPMLCTSQTRSTTPHCTTNCSHHSAASWSPTRGCGVSWPCQHNHTTSAHLLLLVLIVPKRVKHAVDAHANRGCRCAGSEAVEVHHHTAFVLLSNKCCGCVWCLLVVSCNNHTMPSTSWSCVPPPPTSLMALLNKHLKPCVLGVCVGHWVDEHTVVVWCAMGGDEAHGVEGASHAAPSTLKQSHHAARGCAHVPQHHHPHHHHKARVLWWCARWCFVQTRRAANVVVVSINTLGEHMMCINTFAWLTECTHHVNHHHTHTWCLVGCTTT